MVPGDGKRRSATEHTEGTEKGVLVSGAPSHSMRSYGEALGFFTSVISVCSVAKVYSR